MMKLFVESLEDNITVIPATEPESPPLNNVRRFRVKPGMIISWSGAFCSRLSKKDVILNPILQRSPWDRITFQLIKAGDQSVDGHSTGSGSGMTKSWLSFESHILSSFRRFPSERTGLTLSIFATILVLLFSLPNSYAQDTGSGLDFLNIGPSSRMLSLSEATTAADIGPSAIYSNPSLLALDGRSSLDASYTLWIANVHNQFAALNFIRNDRAFAFGVYSSGSSGFEARDRPGPSAGEFSIRYLSLSGAIAQKLGRFSIGVTGQYLREEVFQFRASGYAFNAGLTGSFMDDKLRTAIAIKNLGNMDSLDEESTRLPSSFSAGASASLIQFSTPGDNDLPVLVSFLADWSQPIGENPGSDFIENSENEGFFSLAMDLNIGDLLFVQSGYRWGPTERPVSFGLGLAIESVRVNYALVPFSTGFGTVHSFGVQYYF